MSGAAAPLARAAEDGAAARGAYLAAAAGCDECHTDTKNGGRPFAGGRVFETAGGAVATPNITPDRATGIGVWNLADFTRALRWGVAPDDTHYSPVFPFAFYNRLTDSDIADLKAFLDSVAPVSQPDRAATRPLLSLARAEAAVAVAVQDSPGPWNPDTAKDASWNRGAYLVATLGRCGDCHTPRDAWGAPDPQRAFAGTVAGPGAKRGPKKVPNITPDPETGIGKWSQDDIVTLLKDGQTPDFDFVGGSMAEIVKNTSRLDDADRRAIAVYLQALPAKQLSAKE